MRRHHLALSGALLALVLVAGLQAAPAYGAASGTWTATGAMNTARFYDTATLLPDGQVLVVGGGSATAELYTPATGAWTSAGSTSTALVLHTATLLPDGRVLVAGGGSAAAELYNPATGAWTSTGSMSAARQGHTATLLPDGRVLVAGGENAGGSALSSAELYNPATGTWSSTGSMSFPRQGQDATLLGDGTVLVTAGINGVNGLFSESYDPSTGTWSPSSAGFASCVANQWCHLESAAVLLGSGKVLVEGGLTGLVSAYTGAGSTTQAFLYDPATKSWAATGALNTARERQTATVLADGRVLVAGGVNFINHKFLELAGAELYTP